MPDGSSPRTDFGLALFLIVVCGAVLWEAVGSGQAQQVRQARRWPARRRLPVALAPPEDYSRDRCWWPGQALSPAPAESR